MQQHERLKQTRIENGFRTGTEAAKAIGVSVATYNSHENGYRALTLRSAEQYAKFFKVRSSWLLTGEEPKRYAAGLKELAEWQAKEDAENAGATWGTFEPGTPYRGILPGVMPEIDANQAEDPTHEVVGEWLMPSDFISGILQIDRNSAFLLAVPDDAMTPLLNAGDRGIVDGSKKAYSGDGVYAIRDYDGQLHFRILTKVLFAREPGDEVSVGTRTATEFAKFSDVTIVGKLMGRIGRV